MRKKEKHEENKEDKLREKRKQKYQKKICGSKKLSNFIIEQFLKEN